MLTNVHRLNEPSFIEMSTFTHCHSMMSLTNCGLMESLKAHRFTESSADSLKVLKVTKRSLLSRLVYDHAKSINAVVAKCENELTQSP